MLKLALWNLIVVCQQVRCQTWPIENWNRKLKPYINGDSFADEYGGVQERYWLSSTGVALFVEPEVPLFVAMNSGNDGNLVFTSKFSRPYKNVDSRRLYLTYTLFQSDDVISVHRLATAKVIARPHAIPDEKLFRFPIWSTWARYKKHVDQATILRFANEIRENGFSASQLEIDDDWTSAYGDMEFDPVKFPQPKAMMDRLSELGFRVTLWVHPFASPKSKAFYAKSPTGGQLWVTSPVGGLVTWWNGVGRYMDVTNPDAVRRFTDALRRLQDEHNIASFKFDAGEANWLPAWFRTRTPLANPSTYSRLYAEMANDVDPDVHCQEVRIGARTQHLPLLVRMMDKNSNWTYENGLKTLIPHALLFGIIGYPFLLPDMIGGNAYGADPFPERELFVRWLQVNALMPCLQFSIVPWQYDAEVVEIARRLTALHERHGDRIVELARNCTRTGAPIVRPLWWVAPHDPVALITDSEFLVGDDLLVAPVLEKGATSRDVYLPPGLWWDEVKGHSVEGGKWLKCYDAPLDVLPHFTRQETPTTEDVDSVSQEMKPP